MGQLNTKEGINFQSGCNGVYAKITIVTVNIMKNHQILKFSKNVQSRKTWHSRGKDHYWRLKENNTFNKSDLDALRQALEEAYRIFYDEVWEPMEMLDHLAGGSQDQSLNVSMIGGFSNRHLKKKDPQAHAGVISTRDGYSKHKKDAMVVSDF
jgi:hypothetical protein